MFVILVLNYRKYLSIILTKYLVMHIVSDGIDDYRQRIQ